jgi:hypothetical protein
MASVRSQKVGEEIFLFIAEKLLEKGYTKSCKKVTTNVHYCSAVGKGEGSSAVR